MSPTSNNLMLKPFAMTDATTSVGRAGGSDRIEQVASDFESLFASQILKEMRSTLDGETMFGGDSSDVYGGLFDQFLGQHIAQGGGFGLAKMLRESLARTQSAGSQPIAIP